MGRNSFRFYVKSGLNAQHEVVTPHTLTFQHGTAACVVECRLPVKGERTWQCWTNEPLDRQIRELIADWGFGGDPPGIEATGNEENDKEHEDGSSAFYVTILAAFDLGERCTLRAMTQAELMQAQGFAPRCDCSQLPCICEHMKRADLTLASEAWRVGHTKSVQHFLAPVIAAMAPLEEIGGPEEGDYLVIMESIANEARRRAESLKRQLTPTAPTPDEFGERRHAEDEDEEEPDRRHDPDNNASTTFTIVLEVGGDPDAAREAVDAALDAGALQDAINEYESDDGEVEVTSAVLK